jgi:DNA-binding CsgD family transcriptional regulator
VIHRRARVGLQNIVQFGQPLTEREKEVLWLLQYGHTNGEIAKKLHLTEDTVKTYMQRLFVKFDASTRFELVIHAIKIGLLPCPCGAQKRKA